MLTSAGCVTNAERLNRAATTKGQAAAGVLLPSLPEDLRKQEAHAAVTEGQPVISILARERQALDRANSRQGRTVQFYDDVASKYGTRK
ncbi:hypothetical protein HB770_20770 [Rhizobium leguminosarum bv. viciae]|uniref:Uncharacterized protein n=1 Tax=Rhizobium leguminosarum bv. viciae TaxID=387 RepID=A0A7G6RM38_RHILV|nr:hypothetical protein HB770_20770 [Rhizobium leguminosarum bv. viciae]